MADEEKKEESKEESKKEGGGSNIVLIIIVVLLVLVLAIGGVVAYLMLSGDDEATDDGSVKQEKVEKKKKKKKKSDEGVGIGPMYPLDKFTVNLMSENGRRYLVAKINLEQDGEELTPELDKKTPMIRDIIISILSSKTVEEISTAKGKEKLKEEILDQINRHLEDGSIRHIYFTEFVIQ